MKNNNIFQNTIEEKEQRINWIYTTLPLISLFLLVLLWIFISIRNPSILPSPMQVFERFLRFSEKPIMGLSLWGHIWASLKRVFIAFVFAWVIGISFGIILGWNKKINALFGPLFTAFRAVPPLAWIPLFTIWFGVGEFPKILLIFIGAIIPVVVNTQTGISNVEQLYLDVGTIFNASEGQKLFQIAVPSALDAIFAGVKTSTSAGWMVVLAAEMLGGKSGIGFLITRGMESADLPLILLAMLFIGAIGAFLAIIIQVIERILCPWKAKRLS